MVFSRAALLLCVAVGAAVGRRVLFFGSDPDIQTPVLFFDNKDLDGGSKNFPVVIPPEGGCAPCENLVRSPERDDCFLCTCEAARHPLAHVFSQRVRHTLLV